jgi:large subunit ribosomal protein L6
MSRIGKTPVVIPPTVKVAVAGTSVSVEGPKGKLDFKLPKHTSASVISNTVLVARSNDTAEAKSMHGLSRALIANMVKGVSEGFQKKLEIQGVGFKAMVLPGDMLLMWLGRSHLYCVKFPKEVIVVAKDNKIFLSGDKVAVTMLASIIKTNRPWDPCMKKGIIIEGEFLVQKEGKKKK